LIPGGPHTTTWWSNLWPRLAAAKGHKRGVSYPELLRIVSPLGLEPVAHWSGRDGELERFRQRFRAREREEGISRRAVHHVLLSAYALCEATVCRAGHIPLGALLPYVALAFRKRG